MKYFLSSRLYIVSIMLVMMMYSSFVYAGPANVSMVDGSYIAIADPVINFSSTSSGFDCTTTSATMGIPTQQLYIENSIGLPSTWTVSIAATAPTSLWTASNGAQFDFNDSTSMGCVDGSDTDGFAGRLTIDMSGASLGEGQITESDSGITLGSTTSFEQGAVDSITLISGDNSSEVVGDWVVQDINLLQTVPGGTRVAPDYTLNMIITITQS